MPRPASSEGGHWVVFMLDTGRYALPLATVERVVRAAAITPLPRAPSIVLGALNVGGRVLPVFDIRQRFALPARALNPDDQFVIARTRSRAVALVVDGVQGLVGQSSDAVVSAKRISPELEHIEGVITLEDGMVLIHDLEKFLSPAEASALEEAMKEAPRAG